MVHLTVFSGQFCIYTWLDRSIVTEIRKNRTYILETEKCKNTSVLLYLRKMWISSIYMTLFNVLWFMEVFRGQFVTLPVS